MQSKDVFGRHPIKTLLVLLLIACTLLVGIAEVVLRMSGFLPGETFYKLTDKLVVYDNFHTDRHGVFKANPASAMWQSPVSINSEGFRGPEFDASTSRLGSVLILGDSFAWGASAQPLTNSFPDLLRQAGYVVHNTGIPGVGPTQYEFLASMYIPRLQPDYVIVAFYMGNDLKERPDPMIAGQNLFHVTNAGWIWGFDAQGRPLSAQEAYEYYVGTSHQRIKEFFYGTSIGTAVWNILRGIKESVRKALLGTSIGTAVWNILRGIKESVRKALLDSSGTNASTEVASVGEYKYEYTSQKLQGIAALARGIGSRFYVLVIPSYGKHCNAAEREISRYRPIFGKLNPIYLDNLPERTFHASPSCHLNNEGHRLVAERISASLSGADRGIPEGRAR